MRKTLSAFALVILLTVFFMFSHSDYYLAAFTPMDSNAITIQVLSTEDSDPVIKDLFGVIAGPDPSMGNPYPNLTEHFHDVGVTAVRNNDYFDDRLDIELMFNCGGPKYPSWENCDPNDPANYNWEISDAQFQSWIDGGFEPFLRLGGESANVNEIYSFYGPQNTVQEDNWIVAAKNVTARYLYWQGEGPRYKYGDIWTEFPGKFWDRSDEEFLAFFLKAYQALRSEYPEIKWGGPGFHAQVSIDVLNGDGGLALQLLTQMYEEKIPLDWLGWHLFANQPARWGAVAAAYQDLLLGEGDYANVPWANDGYYDNTEVIVDAYGLDPTYTVNLTAEETDAFYNGAQASAILTGAFIQMQYADLDGAYYYRGGDIGEQESRSGLFHGDEAGSYKPLSYAFKLWSTLYKNYPMLYNVELSQEGKLFVMAGKNDQGQTALLITNPTDSELSWAIKGKRLSFTYYQVDDTLTGSEPLVGSNSRGSIPAYGVQYVILSSGTGVTPVKPVAPSTPIEPSDSVDPVDPVGPTDPVSPSEPSDPTEPADPAEPVDPTDSGVPAEPTDTSTSTSGGGGGGGSSSSSNTSAHQESVCDESPFTDIDGHWGEDYIADLYCDGAVQGKSSTIFAPNDSATRAELVKIALLGADVDISDSATEPFTDVSSKDWFYSVVATAYEEDFVEGYSTGEFKPNSAVNRAEALVILLRIFEVDTQSGSSSPFKDVSTSAWYFPAVYTSYMKGIVEGYSDGTFGAAKNISRAEIAALVVRMQED